MKSDFSDKNLTLEQALIEVRYPAAFKLPDMKYKILDRLTGLFPEYNLEKAESILLRDSKNAMFASINIHSSIFEYNASNWVEFKKGAIKTIKEVSEILDIKVGTRIGIRSIWTKEFRSKDDVVRYMNNTFLKSISRHINKIGIPVVNNQISLICASADIKCNLTIKPLSHRIFEANINDDKAPEAVIASKELLSIDCDVYWDTGGLFLGDIKKYIDNAQKFTNNNIFYFLNEISQEIEE